MLREGVVAESLQPPPGLVRAELSQIIPADYIAVSLERSHSTGEIDTFWIAAALAIRWLYFRCFSCSTGSGVSITPRNAADKAHDASESWWPRS